MFANLEKVMGGTAEKLSNNKVLMPFVMVFW